MKYRLALDMGSTSLGWCVLALDKNDAPSSILDMGVRIFSDGRNDKSKEPLAVARRGARSLRRNYDRRDRRQRRLLSCFIQYGLMPQNQNERKELEHLDPYELRANALDRELSLHELGRALFHINQRRGFKSNRKTDRRENDSSNMKNAIKDLDGKLLTTNSRTLGEYLWKQHQDRNPVRVRSQMVKNKAEYNFYPSRDMYVKEVDAILEIQKKYHPILTDAVCSQIKDILFFQRNLKPVQVGKCRFENGENRARLAYPIVQKFRILQEVNNLQIERLAEGDPEITPEDRSKIIDALLNSSWKKTKKASLTFGQISKIIELESGYRYNLESERREGLGGDETSALMSQTSCFGNEWKNFSPSKQEEIIDLLFESQDPDALIEKLVMTYGVTPEQAEEIANAPLPEGYGAVSKRAIEKMIPFLEKGMKYSDAVKAAGYAHHSDFRTGEVFKHLPYYGEILPNNVIGGSYAEQDKESPEKYFGKINNPSVHIALNQVRKLVNALIDQYGHPEEVVVELARDLKEPPDEISKDQTKNFKENERINKELVLLGVKTNYRNRMLFKLWEDLAEDPVKRCCPFSGAQISKTDIFTGNFEEEHLLPFSRSYNDGRANKVLSSRAANRAKGNKTPFEAFSHTEEWPQILARVQNLPKNKRWRFQEDAWDIAKGEGEDVIARMLNDTRYMSKITKAYLAAVFDNEKGKSKVWAIPGQMTALLRDKWGLNDLLGEDDGKKDRTDHRHHAIDAFVIGCSDRGTFKKLSDAAKRLEDDKSLYEKRHKLVSKMPEPFEGFLAQITKEVEGIVISYKPDHGGAFKAIHAPRPYTIASLHEGTAYGLIKDKGDKLLLAVRTKIEDIKSIKDLLSIADNEIKKKLLGYFLGNNSVSFVEKQLEEIEKIYGNKEKGKKEQKDKIQGDKEKGKKKRKDEIKAIFSGCEEDSVSWNKALLDFSLKENVKKVRLHIEKNKDVMVPVRQPEDRGPEDTRGQPYKYYAMGGNYCAEIYCPNKGKMAGQWQCEIIPNYYAHQKDFIPEWRKNNPTAKLVMRLQIDDMVAYEEDGEKFICRVKKMTSGLVYFRSHQIAKEEADKLSRKMSAGQMQKFNVRKISVGITGRVRDPKRSKQKATIAA